MYRLVWPNHEVYANDILPENIDQIEEAIQNQLRKLGTPEDFWPHREARVVKITVEEGTWDAPEVAESKVPPEARGKGKGKP